MTYFSEGYVKKYPNKRSFFKLPRINKIRIISDYTLMKLGAKKCFVVIASIISRIYYRHLPKSISPNASLRVKDVLSSTEYPIKYMQIF